MLTVQPHGLGAILTSATANAGTPDPNPDEDTASASVSIAQLSTSLTPYMSNRRVPHFDSGTGPTPSLTVVVQANSNLVSTNWVNVYTGTPPINPSPTRRRTARRAATTARCCCRNRSFRFALASGPGRKHECRMKLFGLTGGIGMGKSSRFTDSE